MDDAAARRVRQAGGHLQHVMQCFADRQPAALFQNRAQIVALDELESDEVQPLILAAEEHPRDVLVIEASGACALPGGSGGRSPESAAISGGKILRATRRSSCVSRARSTAAMPPTPIGSINSKWARCRPRKLPPGLSSARTTPCDCGNFEMTVGESSVGSEEPSSRLTASSSLASEGGSTEGGGEGVLRRASPRVSDMTLVRGNPVPPG